MRIQARKNYVRQSNSHGEFWIIDQEYRLNKHAHKLLFYKVYFPKTGFTTYASKGDADAGKIKDFRNPAVCGVGFLGDNYKKIHEEDKELCTELRLRWKSMLMRCYGKPDKKLMHAYKNVTVSDRWHNFCNFYEDVQKLEGFDRELVLAKLKLSLDKDKYQQGIENKVYSKDTCCWLTPKEQQIYTPDHYSVQTKIKFIVTFPDGHEEFHEGTTRFSKLHNLDNGDVGKCLKGLKTHVKHYKFRKIKESD